MNLAFSRLKKKLKYLNIRAYTWDEVLRICNRERIKIHTYPMHDSIKGYYVNERRNIYRKRLIVLNSKLSEFEKLFVILHELVHHFLHVSFDKKYLFHCRMAEFNNSKQDVEADNLALMLAIPRQDLFNFSEMNFEDINPFLQEKLILRQKVYENIESDNPELYS